MKRVLFHVSAIATVVLLPWLVLDTPSLEMTGLEFVVLSVGWGTGYLLGVTTPTKREKCTEESTGTCYQVQAAAGRRLLPDYYDGEWEWTLGDENGRVSHTLPDARHASNEALTCLPEGADDAIVVEVWCDCRR